MARSHQANSKRRLRAALTALPTIASPKAVETHMTERGYEQDWRTGKWRRTTPEAKLGMKRHRGPSLPAIMAKRKKKGRR